MTEVAVDAVFHRWFRGESQGRLLEKAAPVFLCLIILRSAIRAGDAI